MDDYEDGNAYSPAVEYEKRYERYLEHDKSWCSSPWDKLPQSYRDEMTAVGIWFNAYRWDGKSGIQAGL